MAARATRRAFLGASVLLGTGARTLGDTSSAAVPMALQGATTPVLTATAPSWMLMVHTFQDPYRGVVLHPEDPEPGTRYVGVELEIRNDSPQALSFATYWVFLGDVDGVEYRHGGFQGIEPPIIEFNINSGERNRGWMWFAVPEAVELVTLTYVAPQPRLTVPLLNASVLDAGATPLPQATPLPDD